MIDRVVDRLLFTSGAACATVLAMQAGNTPAWAIVKGAFFGWGYVVYSLLTT